MSSYFSTAMEKRLSCSESPVLNLHHCCSQGNLPTRAGSQGGIMAWGPAPACAHQGDSRDNPTGTPAPFNAHF